MAILYYIFMQHNTQYFVEILSSIFPTSNFKVPEHLYMVCITPLCHLQTKVAKSRVDLGSTFRGWEKGESKSNTRCPH
jgi:hypothetical protein